MKTCLFLDGETERELAELKVLEDKSKSEIIRTAVNEFYLREKRANENLRFYIDLYMKGAIAKDTLFTLLPRKDAENIIIGVEIGKNAAKTAKTLFDH